MLYIPITQATLDELLQPNAAAAVISRLKMEELAALLLLQGLPTLVTGAKTAVALLFQAEKTLAALIKLYGGFPLDELQQAVVETLDCAQCQAGADLLAQTDIQLMTIEQLHERLYLKWEEQWVWDWAFKQRVQTDFFASRLLNQHSTKTHFVAKEEERILNVILSEPNESIAIQGYAGSGKTWIIARLMEGMDKGSTLLLAESWGQVAALQARIPHAQGNTFANIAKKQVESGLLNSIKALKGRYGKQYVMSYTQLAKYLHCYDFDGYKREVITKDAQAIVKAFCFSSDTDIHAAHIPRQVGQLTPFKQEMLLMLAKQLWSLVCIPRERISLPVRDYHLVKALALSGLGIPSECTHIIVDETHHLPPVIIQLLQQSPQPVFTFGDYYQALDGLNQPHQLVETLRKNTLAYSVRTGANMTKLYNQLIDLHPIKPSIEFFGNNTKTTQLIPYKRFQIPPQPCAILAKSHWSVFWIAYTLHQQAATYHLFENMKKDLDWLINSAIMFCKNQYKSGNYAFANVASWEDFVAKHKAKEPALVWIDRLIRAGFDQQQLQNILHAAIPQPRDNVYLIRRVWDCRNVEFDRVLLLNDVIGQSGVINDDYAKTVSHIYTGISRAKHTLYLPEQIHDWINC